MNIGAYMSVLMSPNESKNMNLGVIMSMSVSKVYVSLCDRMSKKINLSECS